MRIQTGKMWKKYLKPPDFFAIGVEPHGAKIIAASVGSIPIASGLPDSDHRPIFRHGYPAELVYRGGAILVINKRDDIRNVSYKLIDDEVAVHDYCHSRLCNEEDHELDSTENDVWLSTC